MMCRRDLEVVLWPVLAQGIGSIPVPNKDRETPGHLCLIFFIGATIGEGRLYEVCGEVTRLDGRGPLRTAFVCVFPKAT
ncbi:hypothetical protein F5J12DRAFT_862037 [Pisolithus orientalis]|uniref:uncharacterized protein n=1 Tax=Pisolithus orientalis TaxID=936130 RepID=UPI002224FB63|nr:uncharacterized protein F5J12DRAFT_862037 [Pisolithus orientalis]KAI5991103.1 hypothetical protein F5J12DRAFT_862037 [Pisolithus orientalis]